MVKKAFFIAGCVWLVLCNAGVRANEADFAHQRSDVEADADVTWGMLENGIRYAIMPNEEPPERVSMRLYIGAGSLMETDSQQGLAHFLEHMAFNGTTHFEPGELVEYFQRIGMAFGADTNAHTGFDETVYKIELPENTEDFLSEGLRVLRDYADGMLLLESEIERERGVIISEKRSRDSVGYRTFEAYWNFLFPESLIPRRLPIGTEEVIQTAQRQDFLDYYHDWYTSDRMAVVVVGAVDPDNMAAMIREYFKTLEQNEAPLPDPDLGKISTPEVAVKLHSESEATATEIGLLSVRPYADRPDTRQTRIEDTHLAAANRILSRRFEKLSKAKGAPFSSASAYAYDYLDFFELAGVEIVCKPEQWSAALAVAEQELRRALAHGFTQAEIEEVKANMLNEAEEAVKRAPTRKSRALSSQLVRSISREYVFSSPETDLAITRAAMARFSPKTALQALHTAWQDDSRSIFISGNLVMDDSENKIREVYAASQAVTVHAPKEQAVQPFAYTDFGDSGTIVEEHYDDALNVHQLVFENRVRLNIKQTDFEANTVLVGARLGGGNLTLAPEQAGLNLLASAIYTQGGLEAHSIDELEQILAGKSVGVEFAVDDDAFTLVGQTNPDDFLLQMQLLAAYITAPGYRLEAERLARQNFEQMYVKIEHTVEGIIANDVTRFLASGDYRFGYPEKSKLLQYTTADVQEWLAPHLRNAYLEVSVVGDIDPEQVKAAFAKTVGALPDRADQKAQYKQQRVVEFPTDVHRKLFSFTTKIPRAASIVYWPTTDIWDIHRTRRLSMLSRVFDDRLRVQIREAIGEAYSPYATSRPSEVYFDYGLFYAYAIADPEKTAHIGEIVVKIGENLQAHGVTQDELDRTLKPMLNQLAVYVRNNNYWLQRVLMKSQEKPETLEWARTLIDDYKSITVEELNQVAKEYLTKDRSLQVQVLPESAERLN